MHTPTPWKLKVEEDLDTLNDMTFTTYKITSEDKTWLFDATGFENDETNTANAHRIVACVNACEGMENPAEEIADLVAENLHLRNLSDPQGAYKAEIKMLRDRVKELESANKILRE